MQHDVRVKQFQGFVSNEPVDQRQNITVKIFIGSEFRHKVSLMFEPRDRHDCVDVKGTGESYVISNCKSPVARHIDGYATASLYKATN